MKVISVSRKELGKALGLPNGIEVATIQHDGLGDYFNVLIIGQEEKCAVEEAQHIHAGFSCDLSTQKYMDSSGDINIYQQCDAAGPIEENANWRWHSRFTYAIGDKVEVVGSDMSGDQLCKMIGKVGEIVGFNYADSLVHVQCGELFGSFYEHRLRRVSTKGIDHA